MISATRPDTIASGRRRPRVRRGRAAWAVVLVACAWCGFGISGADESAYRAFNEGAVRWQSRPEFRAVAIDYCVRGSRAMRTRPLLIPAKRFIITLRSAPFLPKSVAVNPTSRAHYEDFSRGPLSGYLHLCGEQPMDQFVGVFESIGRRAHVGDADARQLLDSFHMDFPVCKDAGALESARSVLRDSEASRRFPVRQEVGPLLLPQIAALSRELQVPTDPKDQTADQQQAVLDRLDGFVKLHDPELWRTKQLNDFCGGVWAQVFSPPYRFVLRPMIFLRRAGQVMLIAVLVVALVRRSRFGRRAIGMKTETRAGTSSVESRARAIQPDDCVR